MSDILHYVLRPEPHPSRKLAAAQCALQPDGTHVIFNPEPGRTLEQNAYQFPYLEGFAQQIMWPVNGVMTKLDKEDWKDILTAAFENETNPRLAAGYDGGIVMLGRRTSKYGKKKFSLWMEWLKAAAALKGVDPVFVNGGKNDA